MTESDRITKRQGKHQGDRRDEGFTLVELLATDFAPSVTELETAGFTRSFPDDMTHAVCVIASDGPEFVVGARHNGTGTSWLVPSNVGAVVEGVGATLEAAMEGAGCAAGTVDVLAGPISATP